MKSYFNNFKPWTGTAALLLSGALLHNAFAAPPQSAIDACNGLSQGDSCSLQTPNGTLNGTCSVIENQLACQPEGDKPPPGASFDFETSTLRLQEVDAGALGVYDVSMGLMAFEPITFEVNEVTPTTASGEASTTYEPATGLMSIQGCSVGQDVFSVQLQQQSGTLRFELITINPVSQ